MAPPSFTWCFAFSFSRFFGCFAAFSPHLAVPLVCCPACLPADWHFGSVFCESVGILHSSTFVGWLSSRSSGLLFPGLVSCFLWCLRWGSRILACLLVRSFLRPLCFLVVPPASLHPREFPVLCSPACRFSCLAFPTVSPIWFHSHLSRLHLLDPFGPAACDTGCRGIALPLRYQVFIRPSSLCSQFRLFTSLTLRYTGLFLLPLFPGLLFPVRLCFSPPCSLVPRGCSSSPLPVSQLIFPSRLPFPFAPPPLPTRFRAFAPFSFPPPRPLIRLPRCPLAFSAPHFPSALLFSFLPLRSPLPLRFSPSVFGVIPQRCSCPPSPPPCPRLSPPVLPRSFWQPGSHAPCRPVPWRGVSSAGLFLVFVSFAPRRGSYAWCLTGPCTLLFASFLLVAALASLFSPFCRFPGSFCFSLARFPFPPPLPRRFPLLSSLSRASLAKSPALFFRLRVVLVALSCAFPFCSALRLCPPLLRFLAL